LVLVEWVDATNIPTWENLAEIAEWAKDGGFVCRNVGYLVHEDDDCIVLAARVAFDAEPPQVGLFERLPKTIITDRWTLDGPERTSDLPARVGGYRAGNKAASEVRPPPPSVTREKGSSAPSQGVTE